MAPMIRQDTAQIVEDLLGIEEELIGQISFEEISNLATREDLPFDNTKLMTDYNDFLPPALDDQTATPQLSLDALLQQTLPSIDSQPASPEFLAVPSDTFEYLSPEPNHTQVQPVSLEPQELIDAGAQPFSTELLVMQPLSPEQVNIKVQPASPQQLDQSQDFSILGADSFLVSPSAVIQPQPYSPVSQQLDLSQEYFSHDDLVPSPAETFVPSPSPVIKVEPSTSPLQQQHPADAPKKRGRKRKYPEGVPRSRRVKKPKVYEMGELDDEEAEKKRKNAINAKRHRDMQKKEKEELSVALNQASAERDRLVDLVKQYKQREQQLLQLLNSRGIKILGLENL